MYFPGSINLTEHFFLVHQPSGITDSNNIPVGRPSGIFIHSWQAMAVSCSCRLADRNYIPDGHISFPDGYWPTRLVTFLVVLLGHRYYCPMELDGLHKAMEGITLINTHNTRHILLQLLASLKDE